MVTGSPSPVEAPNGASGRGHTGTAGPHSNAHHAPDWKSFLGGITGKPKNRYARSLGRDFAQFADEFGYVEAQNIGQGDQLDEINAPLPAFDIGDKGLLPAHALGDLGLMEADLVPLGGQEFSQSFLSR